MSPAQQRALRALISDEEPVATKGCRVALLRYGWVTWVRYRWAPSVLRITVEGRAALAAAEDKPRGVKKR